MFAVLEQNYETRERVKRVINTLYSEICSNRVLLTVHNAGQR